MSLEIEMEVAIASLKKPKKSKKSKERSRNEEGEESKECSEVMSEHPDTASRLKYLLTISSDWR